MATISPPDPLLGESPTNATTMHLHEHECRQSFPMTDRIAVDIIDDPDGRRVQVRDYRYTWLPGNLRRLDRRDGDFEDVDELPHWLVVVLERLGLDEVVF